MTKEEILHHLHKKLELNLRELAIRKKHYEQMESLVQGLRADIAEIESSERTS